jgi:hypothetical protein
MIKLEHVPVMLNHFSGVMAGLVPAIHAFLKDVDARDKRGHDVERWFDLIGTRSNRNAP